MGEGEKPEGLTPEEYKAAEGIAPETEEARKAGALDSVEETADRLSDRAERELPNEPRAPRSPLSEEFDRLNRLAAEKLGTGEPDEIPADDLDRSVEPEVAGDIDAMMPTAGRSGMHQSVETATRAEAQQAPNLERARRESMQQEVTEGMQRYRAAFTEAVNLLLLHPRSDTVKERWKELNASNARILLGVDAAVKSSVLFLDPMVIRAKFDLAAERLTRFAQDADRS